MSRRVRAGALLALFVGGLFLFTGSAVRAQEPCGGKISSAEDAGDPCGDNTGNLGDIVTDADGNPVTEAPEDYDADVTQQIGDAVGKTKIGLNFTWTLVAGFLVMFMQAGFALVETGFCQKKNAAHVMMTNFMIYGIGIIGFFLVGYAFMFGSYGGVSLLGGAVPLSGTAVSVGGWNILGTKGFFGSGIYDTGVMAHFLFNLVFMDTTATIVTGAMAERWKWNAFVVYGFVVSMLFYPIFGNWAWGGGWLAQLGAESGFGHGYVDFAGSGVVHGVGGFLALAGAAVIGPRRGKYNADGTANTIPPHSIPMALLGCFILAFGWFGFNGGSSLSAGDLRISVVVANTMLASATGMVAAMFWSQRKRKFGKPDPGMAVNGMLAGLVAITAPCAFVSPPVALLIGAVAGVLVIESCLFFEKRAKIDDPVGAISVHGINGLWGLIALGLFADGTYGAGWNGVDGTVTGLFYGDGGQLVAQLIGCLTIIVWAGGVGWIFFKLQHAIQGIRSKPEDEEVGLDLPEMGVLAYVDETPAPAGAGSSYVSPSA